MRHYLISFHWLNLTLFEKRKRSLAVQNKGQHTRVVTEDAGAPGSGGRDLISWPSRADH